MIDGVTLMDNHWASAMKHAEVVGRCHMAKTILKIDAQQLGDSDEE